MKVTLSSVTAVVEFSGQGSNLELLHMILIRSNFDLGSVKENVLLVLTLQFM